MADVTISGAGAHASAASTDRIPATKSGVKGYLTPAQIADFTEGRASLAELIRDVIGTAATDGTGIDIVVNDGADTITISVNQSELNAFTGDAGAGGVKGVVPAPAAGDAAVGRFLSAGGTWSVPSGGASVDDTAYNATSWDGVTNVAPSKNAVRDKFESLGALAALSTVGTSQIDNDAVTYAKMQNVSATSRVLGRKTAGAGDTEELTFSEVLDFVGSAAQGDIIYRNATAWVRLGAGTSGHFLQTQGTGANPQWATPAGGSVSDAAYASSWDGDTATAPSKNAVYDKFEGLIHPGYKSANWYTPFYFGSLVNGAGSSSGTIYYFPIYIFRSITVSDLGCHVTASAAGGNVKLAIYAHDTSTNRPSGTPLAETGNISTASTGLVSADITGANVTLAAGLYWAAFWMDNTSAGLRAIERSSFSVDTCLVGSATIGNVITSSGFVAKGLTSAETFGAWPNATSETFTEVAENRAHAIILMKAA